LFERVETPPLLVVLVVPFVAFEPTAEAMMMNPMTPSAQKRFLAYQGRLALARAFICLWLRS
jgi:hypothetical protein